MQTPFTEAAQRAREHAARGGQPLLCGKAVHIMKGATASGDGSEAALARMARAHGAKVSSFQLALTRPPPPRLKATLPCQPAGRQFGRYAYHSLNTSSVVASLPSCMAKSCAV